MLKKKLQRENVQNAIDHCSPCSGRLVHSSSRSDKLHLQQWRCGSNVGPGASSIRACELPLAIVCLWQRVGARVFFWHSHPPFVAPRVVFWSNGTACWNGCMLRATVDDSVARNVISFDVCVCVCVAGWLCWCWSACAFQVEVFFEEMGCRVSTTTRRLRDQPARRISWTPSWLLDATRRIGFRPSYGASSRRANARSIEVAPAVGSIDVKNLISDI